MSGEWDSGCNPSSRGLEGPRPGELVLEVEMQKRWDVREGLLLNGRENNNVRASQNGGE